MVATQIFLELSPLITWVSMIPNVDEEAHIFQMGWLVEPTSQLVASQNRSMETFSGMKVTESSPGNGVFLRSFLSLDSLDFFLGCLDTENREPLFFIGKKKS